MKVKGIIFDIDGTLVLSNDQHAQSWVDAFEGFGHAVPFDKVRPLMGMGGDKLLPALVPGLSKDEGVGKSMSDHRKRIFLEKYAHGLQASPGSRELLQRLKDLGAKLVVATSASSNELKVLLKAAQVEDLVDDVTASSEVEESKPAPDVVQVALEKSGLSAGEVVMVGDTRFDIDSATKCGVSVIALRCGGTDAKELHGAVAIYGDPADLLTNLEASPIGGTSA